VKRGNYSNFPSLEEIVDGNESSSCWFLAFVMKLYLVWKCYRCHLIYILTTGKVETSEDRIMYGLGTSIWIKCWLIETERRYTNVNNCKVGKTNYIELLSNHALEMQF